MSKDISAKIQIEGLSELKKLLDVARTQAEQLDETLQRINDCKLTVETKLP